MARLIGISGPYSGRDIPIKLAVLRIGRAEDCELVVEHGSVSGYHARIAEVNGAWILEDLGSSNGTTVNGEDIRSHLLRSGDRIALGEVEFAFHAPPRVPLPAPVPATAPAPAPTRLSLSSLLPSLKSAPAPARVGAAAPPPAGGAAAVSPEEIELVRRMAGHAAGIRREAAKAVVGQAEVLEQILVCILAGGHALLAGPPGLAKTAMIGTLARVLQLDFRRIPFTPDLTPGDITGTEVLETNTGTGATEIRLLPGPVFTNLLLAEEIHRAPPRTQAALLGVMQENCVAVGDQAYGLETPFLVLATQNPLGQEGVHPLSGEQTDLFMLNIRVDYPSEDEEEAIVAATTVTRAEEPQPVLRREQVLQLQQVVGRIPPPPHVVKYATRLVRATRPADASAPEFNRQNVSCGAGPRAGQALVLAAKARAVLEGRVQVDCKDVRRVALPALRHRLVIAAGAESVTPAELIERLIAAVPEPGEKEGTPA